LGRARGFSAPAKAPGLVIISSELTFGATTDNTATATGTRVADADVNTINSDLLLGLPQMTGNTFAQFASSSVESAGAGTAVTLQRDVIIVVARYLV